MSPFLLPERSARRRRGAGHGGVLAAGLALLLGCGSDGGDARDEESLTGSAQRESVSAGQDAVPAKTLRFERPREDLSDVGLGERRSYRLKVLVEGDGEGEAPKISEVVSSCACLSGRLVHQDENGAEVEVVVDGYEVEDIDGVITLFDADRKSLTEHVATIVTSSRPFVQPREVVVTPDSREIQVMIGHGFERKVMEPVFETREPGYDDEVLHLLDWEIEERLELEYLLKFETFSFELPAAAFEQAGSTVVKLGCLEPAEASFEVRVRWDKAD